MNNDNLIAIACLVGFFGDILYQIKNVLFGTTLNSYFLQHGKAESAILAAGLLSFFYVVYIDILRLPIKWYYLAIYGIILDLLFRTTMIFPSLQNYYHSLGYFETAITGGAIPAVLPLFVYYVISKI